MTLLPRFTACGSLKKVYFPKSDRKPVHVDEWHVILKRKRAAHLLRGILFSDPIPKIPGKRLDTWCWTVREFTHTRLFRYSEMLDEARTFVEEYGSLVVEPTEAKEVILHLDLQILQAYEGHLRRRRSILGRIPVIPSLDEIAEYHAKQLALDGICASCGGDLPCIECNLPAVEIDGRGGLKAVQHE